MTLDDEPRTRDLGTLATLTVLALMGLLPWLPVAAGKPPAETAALGAALTASTLFLLACAALPRCGR